MDVNATYDTAAWVRAYLDIWKGMLHLTDKEVELTALIAERHLSLESSVTSPDLLAELLLSPTAKQQIRQAMASEEAGEDRVPMSANNLQNYLSSLKDKGVLTPQGDKFLLNALLIPQLTLTFNFTINK